ncbi:MULTISPECIES: efflux RND transporter permease subunit [unclassified Spirosoma]|uniref:efflux RND transporter permease subunit n=1 Tax=unclassified Spirosoma TaxID=2621999 RepID=UPI00095D58FB|nr:MULTISPECIES: efflux RND transporter permease subunit [unclassified Spirosoma]MBN8824314.1 efflux RND transporter permease subunit [Spirosoma sp.]OJW70216.1 MAG: acriflavin resistance protein [Spirosoma sp. 48-14]
MSLSTLSIKRPVLAIVMNLLILFFGWLGFKYLGVREFPSIDPPVISIRTNYAGANADIIESQITEPLEKQLNSIEGIKSINSSSSQGRSEITVEFAIDVDMERAANDVRDKVSASARTLPLDIDGPPIVSKADANSDQIMILTLQSNTRSHLEVNEFAENVIVQRLQTINGVSEVSIMGQKKYAMRIWMDPDKMAAYNITAQDVKTALDRENVELPSGKVVGSNTELTVKTIGRFRTEEDFNNMIVKTLGDNVIHLSDIGQAELGPENEESVLRLNGVPMIGLGIVPQPGSNHLDISAEVNKRLIDIRKDLPADYRLDIMFDSTVFVKRSVEEVGETLLIAIGLVVLIIFLFFRDWLVAFRPLIDIPVSLVGTFFVMYLMGYSINVLTLLAIVMATGLVVDDGIVVTENIFKKIEQGMNPIEAAIKGSNEIIFAVLSTSITLSAVFLPVIFMEGFVGKLFREFGVVISVAVLISAFVSLTLTPMLNAYLNRKTHKKTRFYDATEPYFEAMTTAYHDQLVSFLKVRWVALPIILATLGMIWFFGKDLPSELAPLDDRNWFRLNMTAPEGTSFESMDDYMLRVGQMLEDSMPGKQGIMLVTAPGRTGSGSPNSGSGRVFLVDKMERKGLSQQMIADKTTKLLKKLPDAKSVVVQQQTISVDSRGGLPVQYVVQAPDFEKLREYLPRFLEEAQKDPTFTSVDANLKFNKPEVNVFIDREKAKAIGVSVADVAQTVQLALAGQRFGYFTMTGRQYQVIGQFDRANRNEPLDVTKMYVKTTQGQVVQLDNIVRMDEQSSPPQLFHFNRYMSATVQAALAPGKTIGDGIAAMNAVRNQLNDPAIRTDLSGASRDYAESQSNTMFSFILALVLVYFILAAQFESFVDPFIIMLTVPLAIGGAVFSLWYFNQTFNIFSQIGIIMLIGLVTKNGILIVEFANQLREEGMSIREAALEAASLRLRPILMTSLATILGALPIALALGAAGQSRMSMGIVIIGGLLFSLVLTLFVIPAMYTFLSRKRKGDQTTQDELFTEEEHPAKPIATV